MKNADIIIIGAGAAGLMAARLLTQAGKKVLVLEARNRAGGRIHTVSDDAVGHIELGAEFIHGDLPVTLELLDKAGIKYNHAGGEMWHFRDGKFSVGDEEMDGWDKLMDCLNQLKEDLSISSFLQDYFPHEKYQPLKKSVLRFVAGYDSANPDKASAFALREEWQNEDNGAQHRLEGGYGLMIDYLVKEIENHGGAIQFESAVKSVDHSTGTVTAINGSVYEADKVLIALPLGILQLPAGNPGAIEIKPSIKEHQFALQQIGFGAIVKVLLKFDEVFWEQIGGHDLSNMGFILSEERIPTWWTQVPKHQPILTGWLGGPVAKEYEHAPDEELFEYAIKALSNIFGISYEEIESKLVAHYVVNWTVDEYTRGSYAYDTTTSVKAREVLNNSIDNKLFFAGEYLYSGPSMGTVEAALTSGKKAAESILRV
ncbi:flavin monoamine oxidase family protein [Mucilaginibacter agri]|uniref:Tryptophan 2-monooxygenase n=1 Tax=Mucilaginibacter agri TaxID=2695265 RepID=A0A965ZKD9_9SPHI|nr:NAD(P)/FAD-dependent oxidoreductase [Mucilaginibacter agri]NCD71281.1 FAD-dependent oxidoreductase [Mucilaginibacter agri]